MIEETLIKRILARPSDSAWRAVYVDWLEERGDPRAELLRSVDEASSLPVYSDRYQALKRRIRELRSGADPTWVTRLGLDPVHRPLFSCLPENVEHRWRLIDEFIELWPAPRRQISRATLDEVALAERRLGVELPSVLRTFYLRYDITRWSGQDSWQTPDRLRIDDDSVVFRAENQWVCTWRIPASVYGDPPVLCDLDGKLSEDSSSLSSFIITCLLLETMWESPGGHCQAGANAPDMIAALRPYLTPCDLPEKY